MTELELQEEITRLKKENSQLRAYKEQTEGTARQRAFSRLRQLLEMSAYDPIISIRAFRVMAECLMCINDELDARK